MTRKAGEDASSVSLATRVAHFMAGHSGSALPSRSEAEEFRWVARARRAQRNRRLFGIGAATAVILVVGVLGGSRMLRRGTAEHSGAPITYRVDNVAPPASGYVLVSESAESFLSFSDGSGVKMAPRTRGRVVEVSERGARFAVESGKVSVHIAPRPRAHWLIEAGPFSVTVHGTSFTLSWNPVEALFELDLESGGVTVSGPVEGSAVQMRAGQTLRVSLQDQTTAIGKATVAGRGIPLGASSPDREPTETPPVHDQEPVHRPPVARLPSPTWSHRNWKAALAEGRTAAVVSEADRLGIAGVLEQADGDDLWALASAARYAGRPSISRQALEAQRRRFPLSDHAREAAFFLGRLHDGAAEEPQPALQWYDRYLAEAPGGLHASDALGRKMTILQRSDRRDEASAVAKDYLRRFPNETYAKAARAVVRAQRQ